MNHPAGAPGRRIATTRPRTVAKPGEPAEAPTGVSARSRARPPQCRPTVSSVALPVPAPVIPTPNRSTNGRGVGRPSVAAGCGRHRPRPPTPGADPAPVIAPARRLGEAPCSHGAQVNSSPTGTTRPPGTPTTVTRSPAPSQVEHHRLRHRSHHGGVGGVHPVQPRFLDHPPGNTCPVATKLRRHTTGDPTDRMPCPGPKGRAPPPVHRSPGTIAPDTATAAPKRDHPNVPIAARRTHPYRSPPLRLCVRPAEET